ncbi:MAG: 4Fe-4S dicluster domain-containing protein [Dysgonamonadaceae bacterium]|jgi:2-oxoglutarate ferredoxin oxidoreductase subunit delta|nr:4Fe-4S dicluster domain-containing protein [Dysgonamonadaceae bacterium]
MAKIRGTVIVDTGRCKGCNLCVVACPSDILALGKEVNTKGYNYAQIICPDGCIGCANCGYVCPDGCITVYKKKMES